VVRLGATPLDGVPAGSGSGGRPCAGAPCGAAGLPGAGDASVGWARSGNVPGAGDSAISGRILGSGGFAGCRDVAGDEAGGVWVRSIGLSGSGSGGIEKSCGVRSRGACAIEVDAASPAITRPQRNLRITGPFPALPQEGGLPRPRLRVGQTGAPKSPVPMRRIRWKRHGPVRPRQAMRHP